MADRGVRVGNSFREDEVRFVVSLFRKFQTGGDVHQLLGSPTGRRLYGKFLRMVQTLDDAQGAAEVEHA